MKQFRLLVFDWDGTLMDSTAHIVDCLRRMAARIGIAPVSDEAGRGIIGLGLKQGIQALYPAFDDSKIVELVQAYRHEYLLGNAKVTPLFPGARETLVALKSSGYHLAVATGKSRAGLDRELAQNDLTALFPITRTADETFSKPHPQMLEEILTDYDCPAEAAVMIGDTSFDLEMASNARVASIGVSYGAHSVEMLQRYHPITVIDSISALLGVLEGKNKETSNG